MANEPNRPIHDKKLQGYPHADQVERLEDYIRKEKATNAKYSQGHLLRELLDDFFAAKPNSSSPDVKELVDAIDELRTRVNSTHLIHSIIRQDIAEFMKVILLNHREFFGEAKLTEEETKLTQEKVETLLEEMFP